MSVRRRIIHAITISDTPKACWIDSDRVAYTTAANRLAIASIDGSDASDDLDLESPIKYLIPAGADRTVWAVTADNVYLLDSGADTTLTTVGTPSPAGVSAICSSARNSVLLADELSDIYLYREASGWRKIANLRRQVVTALVIVSEGILAFGTASGQVGFLEFSGEGGGIIAIRLHGDQVGGLCVLDGGVVASASRDGSVSSWARLGDSIGELWRIHIPGHHFPNRVASGRNRLYVATASGELLVLEPTNQTFDAVAREHYDSIRALEVANGEGHVLTAADDGTVVVYELPTLTRRWRAGIATAYIRAACHDPEEGVTVVGLSDGALYTNTSGQFAPLVGADGRSIRCLAVAPSGGVVVGRDNGSVDRYGGSGDDASTAAWSTDLAEPVYSVAVAKDQDSVFVGTLTGRVVQLALSSGVTIRDERVHRSVVGDIKVKSPIMVTCSDDRSVRFTHGLTFVPVLHHSHPGLALNNIVLHSSGAVLVTSDDGSILEIDSAGHESRRHLPHGSPVRCIAELPGQGIASGDKSGIVNLWRLDGQGVTSSFRFSRRLVAIFPTATPTAILVVSEREVSQLIFD